MLILIGSYVKLTAESEFLVHLYVGPHFKGFCPCWLKHMTINLSIPFTKNFFAQKFHMLKFNVCAQIEALFIKFQKKNKFDPVSLAIPLV